MKFSKLQRKDKHPKSFNEKIIEETLSNDDDKEDAIGLQRGMFYSISLLSIEQPKFIL